MTDSLPQIASHEVVVDGLRLHYTEAGEGEPVLLLHGWPTSSYLWRKIVPLIGRHRRAIALDLPGFGQSDKPDTASYSFRFHARILDGFCAELGIDKLGLAVHDLGGPVGLYWACQNRDRVTRLALLNTLIYPQMSWAVVLFVAMCRLPGISHWLTSPAGIRFAMRLGVFNKDKINKETLHAYQEPFVGSAARRALARTAYGLHPKGFVDIASGLAKFQCPVQIVYGKQDRILPDVAKTMTRAMRDLPQAKTAALDRCGHFLQEDCPQETGQILSDFFGAREG